MSVNESLNALLMVVTNNSRVGDAFPVSVAAASTTMSLTGSSSGKFFCCTWYTEMSSLQALINGRFIQLVWDSAARIRLVVKVLRSLKAALISD